MLIGCCTGVENYSQVQSAGFDYIELAGKMVASLSDNAYSALQKLLLTNPLPCPALNAYCTAEVVIAGPGFDTNTVIDYARFLARRSSGIGVEVVNIGSPFSRILPDGFDYQLALDQAHVFYRETAREFQKYGIAVTVEALSYSFCNFINTLDEALGIVKGLSECDNLGLVLDFYNMRGSGEPDADLTEVSPHIYHVHDSDDAGDPYLRSFYRPENYSVHFRDLQKLKRSGYDNRLSIETDVSFDIEAARYSIDVIRTSWNTNEIGNPEIETMKLDQYNNYE